MQFLKGLGVGAAAGFAAFMAQKHLAPKLSQNSNVQLAADLVIAGLVGMAAGSVLK